MERTTPEFGSLRFVDSDRSDSDRKDLESSAKRKGQWRRDIIESKTSYPNNKNGNRNHFGSDQCIILLFQLYNNVHLYFRYDVNEMLYRVVVNKTKNEDWTMTIKGYKIAYFSFKNGFPVSLLLGVLGSPFSSR